MTFPQAIIFDWDNTLTDTQTTIASALNETRRSFGLSIWSMDEIKKNSARSSRESFPEWFGDKWQEARSFFYQQIEENHLKTVKPLPEVDKLIRWLHSINVSLFVVSNKRGDLLRAEAEALGWTPLFQAIVGSTDAARDKPALDTVTLALSGSKFSVGDSGIWFVGDAEIDIQTGRNAGCTTVWIGLKEQGVNFGADLVFSDCKTLYDLLYNDSNKKPVTRENLFREQTC